jgi:riboflavin kinase/FMN adenylyltransferase
MYIQSFFCLKYYLNLQKIFLKTFHSINDYLFAAKTVLTIGTFDGVHKGHKKILERVVHYALESDCESLILTFFRHPRMVLQGQSEIRLLNTVEEKSALLKDSSIDNLVIHPFDYDFSRLTAEDFVKNVLVEKFNVQKIVIGHDHRFGRNRTANIDDLILFGKEYGFEVEQISAQEIDDIAISSTKIRIALQQGNITAANNYLGYNYFFSGTVERGKQLGRTIGFPTANISIDDEHKLIPKYGVYIVRAFFEGKKYNGIMNIGNRPTVNGKNQTIEVHLLDFNDTIYGKKIKIEVLDFLRNESKFESIDDLKIQIQKDKEISLHFFKNHTF